MNQETYIGETTMSESKALSKKAEEQALAAYGYDGSDNAADLDKDSYAIPRLAIIEKMSPELEEGDEAYIEGAKPGMIVNKVMGTLHTNDNPLHVIPVYRRRVYLEWVPRNQGGGFVAEHNVADGAELMKSTTRNEKNVDILPGTGNELHNVLEFYVLATADGIAWEPAVISMSRTRMAEGKRWNQRIDNFLRNGQKIKPWAQVYPMTTAKKDNPDGVSHVFKSGNAVFLPEFTDNDGDVFAMAESFHDAIKGGTAQVDREAEAKAAAGGTGDPEDPEAEDF
jgi:hypothetical protein